MERVQSADLPCAPALRKQKKTLKKRGGGLKDAIQSHRIWFLHPDQNLKLRGE